MYWFERVDGKLRLCIDINKVSAKLKHPIHPEILRWILVYEFKQPYPGDCKEVSTYTSYHYAKLINELETYIESNKDLIEKITVEDLKTASLEITEDMYNKLVNDLLTNTDLYPELDVYVNRIRHPRAKITKDKIESMDENASKAINNVVNVYRQYFRGE